jgi:hypothetical protein
LSINYTNTAITTIKITDHKKNPKNHPHPPPNPKKNHPNQSQLQPIHVPAGGNSFVYREGNNFVLQRVLLKMTRRRVTAMKKRRRKKKKRSCIDQEGGNNLVERLFEGGSSWFDLLG